MIQTTQYRLLDQVIVINKKYKEITRITGEGYNIFQILKMGTAENRLHSAFIADLLNPKGEHLHGDVFLKLFVEEFIGSDFVFDSNTAIVEVEKYIGPISADKTRGGRIDIFISDKNNTQIFIENKIYAGDQENQLVRYFNSNPKAHLIYLCLHANEVSKFSCKDLELGKDFHIRNYNHHILNWLHKCRMEAVSHPLLRETITQYLNIVKYLTGKTINNDMKNELAELITKDKEYLEAAFAISSNVDEACILLLDRFKSILQEIADELDLIFEYSIDWNKKYNGFIFYRKTWNKASINFQFQNYASNLVYGISLDEEAANVDDKTITETFDILKELGGNSNSWWPFYKKMEQPYLDWESKEPWLAIIDGSIKNVIYTKVKEINGLIGEYPL
ncbi:MAG: PD-(D/E)XK nuclease family protein [Daejeonella sp.]|uniref:PDDEXK-like family protein n=1 Tax=Daejeonella sp. TaxID=2805397 RepID=UPI002736C348|nr:PD-(D/E)XK nuclease family protein [Daejeonella sp.]MDP3469605.1 PD-(D/E)XK nuclease family protein [Daejeonella sp.]